MQKYSLYDWSPYKSGTFLFIAKCFKFLESKTKHKPA